MNKLKKFLKKEVKKLNWLDFYLLKISVFFFAWFITTFLNLNIIVNYRWLWFVLFFIFGITPICKLIR